MQVQGQTGPQVNTDGGAPNLRIGRLGELVCADSIGKFYELARRGQLFTASMQAGASLGTVLTAAATTLTLYNPLGSTVNLVFIQCGVTLTAIEATTPLESYAVVYAASLGMSTGLAPTSVTAAKVSSALLQVGTGGNPSAIGAVGQCWTAATLGATAPIVVRTHPTSAGLLSTTASAGDITAIDYVEGALSIGPGVAVTIQGIGTTAVSGIVSYVWGEIPN